MQSTTWGIAEKRRIRKDNVAEQVEGQSPTAKSVNQTMFLAEIFEKMLRIIFHINECKRLSGPVPFRRNIHDILYYKTSWMFRLNGKGSDNLLHSSSYIRL